MGHHWDKAECPVTPEDQMIPSLDPISQDLLVSIPYMPGLRMVRITARTSPSLSLGSLPPSEPLFIDSFEIFASKSLLKTVICPITPEKTPVRII